MADTVTELVKEFTEKAHLTEADANRSAFCVLAYHKGWNQVRIARYLGITRARVGQRLQKFKWYTQRYQMPTLQRLLSTAKDPKQSGSSPAVPVQFTKEDWEDPQFAQALLEQVK